MHDHPPHALAGSLAGLAALSGALLGERAVSAIVGLLMSLIGTALYQLGMRALRVAGDALEARARRRFGVSLVPAAPERPETPPDVPPAA